MFYDPVKDRLGDLFSRRPWMQKQFFRLLHLVFLRSWYVRRETLRLLKRFPADQPIRVLDAGTGFAQYAYFIAANLPNAQILAVDVKQDYLDNAERFFTQTPYADRVTFQYEDLTDLQADGPFDFILSVDVMEHIEDDRGVFRHFERVLAPGGYVMINTPSDQGGSDVTEDGDTSFIEEHVRDGYNLDELKGKLSDAGLTPVQDWYTYGKHGSRAWRMLIRRPISWMGKTMAAAAILPFYYLFALPVGTALNAADTRTDNPTGTGLLVVAQKKG
ncbi:MAG: class I SAM-dependent methyltransferase [Rhodothermales bacterium]